MKSPGRVLRVVANHGAWAMGAVSRHGWPRHLVHFGDALGDDLLCTVILREMRKRGRRGLWMSSRHPELFALNDDVDAVVSPDELYRYERLVSWAGGRFWHVHYAPHDFENDYDPPPERHIIALLCQSAGLSGPVTLRPYLRLSDRERAAGRLAPKQIAIHSSGMGAAWPMRNKEWFPERFQAVVDALRDEYTVVQLGTAKDPPLEGCMDLRGRTTVRETAAILANSRLFVGQVGFLMHLTRAVDRPAVIVFGGRERPWQSGYSCNTNLATELPCSPCWRWNVCDFDRECMRRITADEVVEAVRERLARADEPLVADVDELPLPGTGIPVAVEA